MHIKRNFSPFKTFFAQLSCIRFCTYKNNIEIKPAQEVTVAIYFKLK